MAIKFRAVYMNVLATRPRDLIHSDNAASAKWCGVDKQNDILFINIWTNRHFWDLTFLQNHLFHCKTSKSKIKLMYVFILQFSEYWLTLQFIYFNELSYKVIHWISSSFYFYLIKRSRSFIFPLAFFWKKKTTSVDLIQVRVME